MIDIYLPAAFLFNAVDAFGAMVLIHAKIAFNLKSNLGFMAMDKTQAIMIDWSLPEQELETKLLMDVTRTSPIS